MKLNSRFTGPGLVDHNNICRLIGSPDIPESGLGPSSQSSLRSSPGWGRGAAPEAVALAAYKDQSEIRTLGHLKEVSLT